MVGLQVVFLFGHLGANEQPTASSIKLGGSPSNELSFTFSPTTEGVDSKSALCRNVWEMKIFLM